MGRPRTILLALLCILPACADGNGPSRPACDAAPCLAARVNGDTWRNTGFTPGAAMYWTLGDTASITALRRRSDNAIEAITLRIKTFNGTGTYALGDPATGAYGEFVVAPGDTGVAQTYRTGAAVPGSVTITGYDPDSLTASGTFAFETASPSPYRITQGTFTVGLMLPASSER